MAQRYPATLMDEPSSAPGPDPGERDDEELPRRPLGLPADHAAAAALAAEEAEVRRLVEAGAQTPEELRALAERLRVLREREDALWRDAVKPSLVKAGKGRLTLGGRAQPGGDPTTPGGSASQTLALGVGLLGLVLLVVLLAAGGSFLVILVPVVALLAYAWWQGRQGGSTE